MIAEKRILPTNRDSYSVIKEHFDRQFDPLLIRLHEAIPDRVAENSESGLAEIHYLMNNRHPVIDTIRILGAGL